MSTRTAFLTRLAACTLLLGWSAATSAQVSVGAPGAFVIRGGTVVVGNGQRLENASVLVRDGKIAEVGSNVQAGGATEIDARGKFVYPGMMDSSTPIGLSEIGSVATMNLSSELGEYNPHNRALVAINVESEMISVTRSNGVTHAITAPSGGVISGQAALVNLSGWTWEDMAVKSTAAVVINYPREPSFRFGGGDQSEAQQRMATERIREQVRELKDRLLTAKRYDGARRAGSAQFDLQYEALRPLMRGEVPALVSADTEAQIRGAIALQDSLGIRVVISGGDEAWKVAELLAQKRIPVVLGSMQSTPGSDEPYDAIYAQPGVLHRAGVKIAFSTGGASNARHVPYHAALAVAYGLPSDAALSALTIWPAEIFGVADQLGTIEAGKVANLFVADSDPLDVRSQVAELFIGGRRVAIDDRHKQLYDKYVGRPKG